MNKDRLMELDYEIIVEDRMQYLTYKGSKLPRQIETIIKQDSEDAHSGICLVTVSFIAKLKNTE